MAAPSSFLNDTPSTLACRPSAMILEGSSQNLSPLRNNWGRRPHSRPDTARPLRKRWRESISPLVADYGVHHLR
jgi:hypothetical protein